MRAGKLDRHITIAAATTTVGDAGQQVQSWVAIEALRAQIIEASTEETQRAFGAAQDTLTVFRTRFVEGITTANVIVHDDQGYDIVGIKEIGRRVGLEIRAIRRRP